MNFRAQISVPTIGGIIFAKYTFGNCLPASLFKKGLSENPWQRLDLIVLSPNPIGVINRRNGFGATVGVNTIGVGTEGHSGCVL
jgi:hypothetical protein